MKTIVGCAVAACVAAFNLCVAQEPRRQCRPAEWPKRLPALDAVVDSASLFDLIDTSPESDTTSMVVGILYREDGPATVRLLEPSGAPSLGAVQFVQIMSRALRRVPPPSPMGALRVRVRAGPDRAGAVERSIYCPPKPVPTAASPGPTRFALMPGERPRSGKVNVAVQVFIDEAGTVSDVRLVSGSGFRELDETIVADERRTIYLPATIDGAPIPSWRRSNGTTMKL